MTNCFTFSDLSVCNHDEIFEKTSFTVKDGKFSDEKNGRSFSLGNDYIAYPGLINAHDHLLGSYFPKVGNGPYLNWRPWDNDLKNSLLYSERKNLTIDDLYGIGNYRQILSGVTTVCDHMPHEINDEQAKKSLIKIINQYCVAHEISSYELKWGREHEVEIREAKEKNIPFVTHIEEGFDEESLRGINILNEKGGVFENSVLVHCIGCSFEDIRLMAEKKASMVWCPSSNAFMFNQTADIKEFLDQEVNVCLGTDSPMSGGINLLEEMRFAKDFFMKKYSFDLDDRFLMQMVTMNSAKAFKLEDQVGKIKKDLSADFLLIKKNDDHESYYETLINADMVDLEMVFRQGVPLFFKEKWLPLLEIDNLEEGYQKVKVLNEKEEMVQGYLIGKPLTLLSNLRKKIGFNKQLPFFNIA